MYLEPESLFCLNLCDFRKYKTAMIRIETSITGAIERIIIITPITTSIGYTVFLDFDLLIYAKNKPMDKK